MCSPLSCCPLVMMELIFSVLLCSDWTEFYVTITINLVGESAIFASKWISVEVPPNCTYSTLLFITIHSLLYFSTVEVCQIHLEQTPKSTLSTASNSSTVFLVHNLYLLTGNSKAYFVLQPKNYIEETFDVLLADYCFLYFYLIIMNKIQNKYWDTCMWRWQTASVVTAESIMYSYQVYLFIFSQNTKTRKLACNQTDDVTGRVCVRAHTVEKCLTSRCWTKVKYHSAN